MSGANEGQLDVLVGEWERRVEKLKADYETNKAQQNKSIIAGRILELGAAICEVKQRCLANKEVSVER